MGCIWAYAKQPNDIWFLFKPIWVFGSLAKRLSYYLGLTWIQSKPHNKLGKCDFKSLSQWIGNKAKLEPILVNLEIDNSLRFAAIGFDLNAESAHHSMTFTCKHWHSLILSGDRSYSHIQSLIIVIRNHSFHCFAYICTMRAFAWAR